MKSNHFFVAGIPKGQPRPKAFARGGHAGVYDPGTADEWKALVRLEASRVLTEATQNPVCVRVEFWMPRPKSHFRSNGELKPTAPRFHSQKPDADNLAKAVMDALTNLGTAWKDDSQVARLIVTKRYADNTAGASVDIMELVA